MTDAASTNSTFDTNDLQISEWWWKGWNRKYNVTPEGTAADRIWTRRCVPALLRYQSACTAWSRRYDSEPGHSPNNDEAHRRKRSYTYDDMLAAWVAGKENEHKYGSREGDAPDFATWILGCGKSLHGGKDDPDIIIDVWNRDYRHRSKSELFQVGRAAGAGVERAMPTTEKERLRYAALSRH